MNHDGSSLHWFTVKLYLQILTLWFSFMYVLNLARNTVLVFPSSSGSMRMMKYTVRTNASNLTLYVVPAIKILPLFAKERKRSVI